MGESDEGLRPEQDEEPFFTDEDGRNLVLEAANIEEGDNAKLLTFRVVFFTVESTVQPQPYESLTVRARVEPVGDQHINVLVYDPAKKVTAANDADVIGTALRQIGRQVDMMAVELAADRAREASLAVDRRTVKMDQRRGRIDAERGVPPVHETI